MSQLTNKHILVGVTGSIAAYKSVDLVRRLREHNAQVRVVMTLAATAFITPLTLQVLSGQTVYTQLLDTELEATIGHIELARWADIVLIAPASADFLAKLAHGHADDLLSTLCLATSAPIVVAPAMNQYMWQAKATQRNYHRLQNQGVQFLGPTTGYQACGETGIGRMIESAEIIKCLEKWFEPGPLIGCKVLITAGPTRENIDPVRFIGNRSSGRMGYAIARAIQALGAEVILISGPVAISPPVAVQLFSVYSAQDMLEAVAACVEDVDIFIATAAVADYRPIQPAPHKLKKHKTQWTINLERTPDILAYVTNLPFPPFTVGFAAETDNLAVYARDKLKHKKLNMIAANQVGVAGPGFESEENALSVFWEDGEVELPQCPKERLAEQLVTVIAERYLNTQGDCAQQPHTT